MNFKRYNGSDNSWTDSHYIKKTDTDTITTLPAIVYPLAQTATLSLKGNTVQNGTPTPSNPVQVIGVGDDDNGQIKIPISSANTTTNVYLGETQTTRKIKKLVLTGNVSEQWEYVPVGTLPRFRCTINASAEITQCVCTHYRYELQNADGNIFVNSTLNTFTVCDSNFTSLEQWKSYLSQQYAAGTPVTVWYVLANETTGIVNEPLMKIGDYADSISSISIPTTVGANTLDVQTTLKPSEVTASFNGWHPVSSAHERSGGNWT